MVGQPLFLFPPNLNQNYKPKFPQVMRIPYKGTIDKLKPCTSPRIHIERRPQLIAVPVRCSLYALLAFFFCFTCSFLFYDETLIHVKPNPKSNDLSTATNFSHIVFGISSSSLTWDRLRSYNELWWRPKEMHGYVWLDEDPPADATWPDTVPPYRICKSNSSVVRVAKTIVETYRAVQSESGFMDEIRWFVIGDDATIFFPDNLVAMLGKYNHDEMYYIGSISESVEQDLIHSYGMAYDGAGFAISYKAAAELAVIMDVCLEQYDKLYGSDERIQACLNELGVTLTLEPGFHQVDLQGNIYGMLAAHPVAPLLSLNRMNIVPPISPLLNKTRIESLKSLVDVSKYDPSRTLQQAICYEHGPGLNWSISVSWGYSVQVYPWSVAPQELVKPLMTFTTWRTSSSGPFTFDARPVYNRSCELPLTFFLDEAKVDTGLNGISRTVTDYLRNDLYKNVTDCELPSFIKAFELQRVRVVATKMDPDEWKHAPRRHCCQTSRERNGKMLTVQISQCGPGQRAAWRI